MTQTGAERSTAVARGREQDEWFLPDFCDPRSVFIAILLAELMVLVYTLASGGLPRFNWERLALSSWFVQWIVLLSIAILCLLRNPFSRLGMPLASSASVLLVLVVTAASSYLALGAYPQLIPPGEGMWWLLRNLLVAAVLTGVVLRYFYLQQQLRVQEKLELQARLDSLRVRIRPHFLFNTLNSIASLIASRPEEAEQAVEDLAELFRASLQENRREMTVADELDVCETYLGIEQLRLGDRLRVDWQVDPAVRQELMPSLVLQPLVENSIYHGVSQIAEGGVISIAVGLEGGTVRVTVDNPVPAQAVRSEGHHMALDNVSQRLQALYGAAGRLHAEHRGDSFHVELSYPREVAL